MFLLYNNSSMILDNIFHNLYLFHCRVGKIGGNCRGGNCRGGNCRGGGGGGGKCRTTERGGIGLSPPLYIELPLQVLLYIPGFSVDVLLVGEGGTISPIYIHKHTFSQIPWMNIETDEPEKMTTWAYWKRLDKMDKDKENFCVGVMRLLLFVRHQFLHLKDNK